MSAIGQNAQLPNRTIMNLAQVLLLGALQGLTEFLPISSSGHLVIAQRFLGIKEPKLFFDVAVHCGTLLAVLLVLRQEIASLITGTLRAAWHTAIRQQNILDEHDRSMARLSLFIIMGLLPTALFGLVLRTFAQHLFTSLLIVGIMLLLTGFLLWITKKRGRGDKNISTMTIFDAFLIGCAQGIAVTPGISRSGFTIACGLFRKLEPLTAAHFSFLLSLPAIIGAMVLEWENPFLESGELLNAAVGALTATLVGYLCLRILFRVVQKGYLHFFSPYCWTLGSISIIASFLIK